jgi:hypothetical protein
MSKFYLILIAFALLTGCKSASKSYSKGDYADAIELGLKKLQKDPYDGETTEIVKNSYTYAVNSHEDQIRILSNSKSETRFASIFQHYISLQDLYHTIQSYPQVAKQIAPRDYSEYVETYREKAAGIHIDRAENYMEEGTKLGYKNAYYELNNALRFVNNYELKRRRDSAYDAALTKVVLVPMKQYYGGYSYSNSHQLRNFEQEILRTLKQNQNSDFVRYYSDWEARSERIVPDHFMELNLGRIMIGRPIDSRSTREVSKEVVIKETVFKPDSVVKQYGTVKARITSTRRTLLSEADLIISLRDERGRIVWDDRFTGQHEWKTEFSTYTGDERALSESDKSQVNKQESYVPAEEQILEELLRQIQQDLSSRLRSHYSRY